MFASFTSSSLVRDHGVPLNLGHYRNRRALHRALRRQYTLISR